MNEEILHNGDSYHLWDYDLDEVKTFEPIVIEHVVDIFGEGSLCLSKQKLRTTSGIGSIPDGLVIDFNNKNWYILEVELSNHPIHEHVVPQVSKFISGIKNPETRKKIVNSMYDEISSSPLKTEVKKIIGEDEIHKTLSDIVASDPILVIVIEKAIDGITYDLEALRFETKVIEFKTFIKEGSNYGEDHIHLIKHFNDLVVPFSEAPSRVSGSRKPSITGKTAVLDKLGDYELNSDESEIISSILEYVKSLDSTITIRLVESYQSITLSRGNRRFAVLKLFEPIPPREIGIDLCFLKFDGLRDTKCLVRESFEDEERGVWRMQFELNSKEDLDYAKSLIKQVYDFISRN